MWKEITISEKMRIFNYTITIRKEYPDSIYPYQQRYVENKRKKGVCTNGGCWNRTNGFYKCPSCRKKDTQRWIKKQKMKRK